MKLGKVFGQTLTWNSVNKIEEALRDFLASLYNFHVKIIFNFNRIKSVTV